MASKIVPKRKKTIAGTSSASYDASLFRSLANQDHYYQYPDDKKFVQEKAFLLNEGEFDHIQANINNRGWGELTSCAEPASKQLAMEFFANAYQHLDELNETEVQNGDSDEAKYTSYVRGKKVPYTPAVINQLLELENIEHCGFTAREAKWPNNYAAQQMVATMCRPRLDWERSLDGTVRRMKTRKLNPTAKAWATFVLHTLLPSFNMSELNTCRAILVYTIMLGEPINIVCILATSLHDTAHCEPKLPSLNHASLIAQLCERATVKKKKDQQLIKPSPAITKKWINCNSIPVGDHPAPPQPDMHDHMDADPQQQDLHRLERLETRVQQIELSQREGQARLERGMLALYRAFASSQAGQAFDPSADIFAPQAAGEGSGAGVQDHD